MQVYQCGSTEFFWLGGSNKKATLNRHRQSGDGSWRMVLTRIAQNPCAGAPDRGWVVLDPRTHSQRRHLPALWQETFGNIFLLRELCCSASVTSRINIFIGLRQIIIFFKEEFMFIRPAEFFKTWIINVFKWHSLHFLFAHNNRKYGVLANSQPTCRTHLWR